MRAVTNALKKSTGTTLALNEPVVLLLLVAWAGLALVAGHQALASLRFTARSLVNIGPFFALAVFFAAYAKASGADGLIARAFSGNSALAIVAGALAGALSPFCSCGVIPLIAAMLASGVPLPPVMAFCLASPVMDPEMFILTAAGISFDFAMARTITAIGMGLLAGFAVSGLQRLGYLGHVLKTAPGCGCAKPAFDAMATVDLNWRFWRDSDRKQLFLAQVRNNGFFLGKWMTLAFFIESLMIAYLPVETVGRLVGQQSAMAIPIAAIIGIPAYMNGYAAIPMISGLMDLGMSPGAALTFATAGAVSSVPAALAVYALVRRAVFFVYLALGISGSLIAGYFFQHMQQPF